MDSESELIFLISQLLFQDLETRESLTSLTSRLRSMDFKSQPTPKSEFMSLITKIICLVSSMDLNSQPKPESEFMSLITQTISVFYSMGFETQPMPLQKLISYFQISLANSMDSDLDTFTFFDIVKVLTLKPEPELVSLIYQIFSFVTSMGSKSGKFLSLCPQKQVYFLNGECHLDEEERQENKWDCLPLNWVKLKLPGEDVTHFYCHGCDGKNHKEYKKAPIEIKHHLHRKHSLQLLLLGKYSKKRQCYWCNEDFKDLFYYCWACDFVIEFVCARKPPVLSIDYPKWHEHTLHLFPRHASSLTCNLCALAHASCPLYMCPNCDFVAHLSCLNELPRVIRISRHYHRISFTSYFDHGDSSCGVCRRKIDNEYGGYSCIKDGCSYAAHSRCATQRNIWDGKELEGEPEEEEDTEDIEPFVRISDGIIEHFSHKHHHLKLDENTGRDYDENKVCHACITPIYFGNFYSCMQCEFILHEQCANLSRKIYYPIHPHLLTLGYHDSVVMDERCTACSLVSIAGFFYMCGKEGCDFKLHGKCATVSEPLVHESHIHPLFLTCKPGEERRLCSICKDDSYYPSNETFNCIEECDFALCFGCATLPDKVRYKHDKHILTLSYGKETSTMTYWCEVCEGKVNSQQRFYTCGENCCVTLHIECLLGKDLYMKPDSTLFFNGDKVDILPNNHHMTRPICSVCDLRCSQKIFLNFFGSICCSKFCIHVLY